MAERKFDKADFDTIVDNLINFLSSQSQFKDFNFQASGIRTIIELLAYNLQYKLYYLNQAETEAFLDSAQLRDSVVSIAKHLGYTPRTLRSSRAVISFDIDTAQAGSYYGNPPASFYVLDTNTKFTTSINGTQYTYTPVENTIVFLQNGVYSVQNLEIIEGQRLIHSYEVDTSLERQRFIIPNTNVDETSLRVIIKDSENSTGQTLFTRHENLVDVGPDSTVYFLQESQGGKLELIFGDGIIGKALDNGNIVEISYIVSSGDAVSGASNFITSLPGADKPTVIEAGSTPSEGEDIESIRKLAPLAYEAQNRAVTESDYSALLLKDIPDVEFLKVWGGEENDPPIYGVVYISAKPEGRNYYSTEEKESILETYVKPRNVIAVEARFVDPDFIRLVIDTKVLYDDSVTSLTIGDIQQKVLNSVIDFENSELKGFNSTFRYSKLVDYIDSADPSINSSLTDITLKYRIFPAFNQPEDYIIAFSNELDRGDACNGISTLNSSGFLIGNQLTYIQDDGAGNLEFYRIVNDQRVVVRQNVGIIDYTTGLVCLEEFSVDGLPNGVTYVDISISPKSLDINASQNQILLIEENEDVSVFVEEI